MLESFLKGEHNDSLEIVNEFNLKLHAVYILVCDMGHDSREEKITFFNQNEYKMKKFLYTEDIADKTEKILLERQGPEGQEPLIKATEEKLIFDEVEFKSAQSQQIDMSMLLEEEVKRTQSKESHREFLQNERADDLSQSFDNHLADLNAQKYRQRKEPTIESRNIRGKTRVEGSSQAFKWWNQRLILLIEILGINGKIWKYRNGKVKTVDKNPFAIKSLLISTPLNLTKAWESKLTKIMSYEQHSALDYNNLITNIMNYDFRSLEQETNPMVKFLCDCGLENYANFLKLFLRYVFLLY